ncbi:MAG: hypothetical protein AB7G11_06245 [Phycisphaerales bacterium]
MTTIHVEPKETPSTVKPREIVITREHHAGRLARWSQPVGGPKVVGAALGGMVVTALWIAMFTVGLSVPSLPFRSGLLAVGSSTTPPDAFQINGPLDAIYALTVVCFAYTPTNLVLLCCLASLIGCLGYYATTNGVASHTPPTHPHADDHDLAAGPHSPSRDHPADTLSLRPAISAVMWGFFIYLFLISGTLLAMENPFASTTPEQYLRLAGTASLLAFVVGWQPEVITRLVTQIGRSRISSDKPAQ